MVALPRPSPPPPPTFPRNLVPLTDTLLPLCFSREGGNPSFPPKSCLSVPSPRRGDPRRRPLHSTVRPTPHSRRFGNRPLTDTLPHSNIIPTSVPSPPVGATLVVALPRSSPPRHSRGISSPSRILFSHSVFPAKAGIHPYLTVSTKWRSLVVVIQPSTNLPPQGRFGNRPSPSNIIPLRPLSPRRGNPRGRPPPLFTPPPTFPRNLVPLTDTLLPLCFSREGGNPSLPPTSCRSVPLSPRRGEPSSSPVQHASLPSPLPVGATLVVAAPPVLHRGPFPRNLVPPP